MIQLVNWQFGLPVYQKDLIANPAIIKVVGRPPLTDRALGFWRTFGNTRGLGPVLKETLGQVPICPRRESITSCESAHHLKVYEP